MESITGVLKTTVQDKFLLKIMGKQFFVKLIRPLKQSKSISVSFIMTCFGILLLCSIYAYISFQNKVFVTFYKMQTASEQVSAFSENDKLDVRMEIPIRSDGVRNCWQEENGSWGSQYDIYIYNKTRYPFLDWTLEMSVPLEARIDSSWNGEYSQESGKIIIKGSGTAFTSVVNSYGNVKVGFVLYTNDLMYSSDFYLTGRFLREPLKQKDFIISLIIFAFSFLTLIVSLVLYYFLKKQANLDNEKIESLIKLCARFIDVRDEYTKMHSLHVGLYAKKIAEELGYDEEFQKNIYYMGMMHDVGKVLTPMEILCKPTKLDDKEWEEMKKHTIYGAGILEGFTAVPGIREAALYHHERYDGSGYPCGLKGDDIPIQARIIGVADSYDAMHTNRSYRAHLSDEVILQELEKNKGSQFDPKVAEAMQKLLKEKKLDV